MGEADQFVTVKEAMAVTGLTRWQVDHRMNVGAIRYKQDPVTGKRWPHLGDLVAICPQIVEPKANVIQAETESNI